MTVTVASVPESHIRSSLGAGLLTYFLMFTPPQNITRPKGIQILCEGRKYFGEKLLLAREHSWHQ